VPAPGAWDHIDEATVASLTLAAGLRIAPERLPALTAQVRALGLLIADLATVDCSGIAPAPAFEPRDAWRPSPATQVDGR
jgi:hypothetical protein